MISVAGSAELPLLHSHRAGSHTALSSKAAGRDGPQQLGQELVLGLLTRVAIAALVFAISPVPSLALEQPERRMSCSVSTSLQTFFVPTVGTQTKGYLKLSRSQLASLSCSICLHLQALIDGFAIIRSVLKRQRSS